MNQIFIITQSEPFYIPKMIMKIMELHRTSYEVVGFTILKPSRKNKSIIHWFRERIKLYKLTEILIVFSAFVFAKIDILLRPKNSRFSSRAIFVSNNIREIFTDDINDDNYLSKLDSFNLDYIVSISCPQLFGEKILGIPKKTCLNAHGTLLPRHRGVFGSWWTLFNNDKTAGSTIHTMELKLDAGKIILQTEFEVSKSDTQYSIAYKTKKNMAYDLIEIFKNDYNNIIQPKYKSSYHRAPTKLLGKEFHKKGLRVISINDVKNILRSGY